MAEDIKKGLLGIVVDETTISQVVPDINSLTYRGYAVQDLCDSCSFEEVAYLILNKELPNKTNLKKFNTGKKVDTRARHFLKKDGFDYPHGTGHGVGFFSNVHEGPQSITKINTVKLEKGMIVSNEPGYYKKGHYGIRIENLLYIKKINNKLHFENLTLAPIEKDLINFKLLNNKEKKYLNGYHMKVYMTLNPYLNKTEKTWLKSFTS